MKRFLALMLALVMVLSMTSTVWATEDGGEETDYVAQIGSDGQKYATLAEAVAAVENGGTINLLRAAEGAGIATFVSPTEGQTGVKNFTIDFKGYTYTVTGPAVGSAGTITQGLHLEKGGNVILKNGWLLSSDVETSGVKMLVQNYGNLTFESMYLSGAELGEGRYVSSNCNGTVVIKDTIILAPENGFAFDADGTQSDNYPSVSVTVTGNSQIEGEIELSNPVGSTKASITVESGRFSHDPTAYLAEGLGAVRDEETGFFVVEELGESNAVAKVGNKYYTTLAEAVADAPAGGTVTMLRDAVGAGIGLFNNPKDGQIANKDLTIDFGGKVYTVTAPAVGSTGTESQGFHFEEGKAVTLKNGYIVSEPGSGVKMLVQNYCDLTLYEITLDGYNLDESDVGYYTLSNCHGEVTIESSRIAAHTDGVAFDADNSTYDGVEVTVTNGSVIEGKIELTNRSANSAKAIISIEDGSFSVKPDNSYIAESVKAEGYDTFVLDGGWYVLGKSADLGVNPVETATGTPKVEYGTGATEADANAVAAGMEASGLEVSDDVAVMANKNDITVESDEVKQAITSANLSLGTNNENAELVVQTYPEVKVETVDTTTANPSMTLDIKAYAQLVVTAKNNTEDIVLTGDNKNAAKVGEPQKITVNTPVELTVGVPLALGEIAMQNAEEGVGVLYVLHIKDDGKQYNYIAEVYGDATGGYYATFVADYGFSTFKLSATEIKAVNSTPTGGYVAPSGHQFNTTLQGINKVTVGGNVVDSKYYTIVGTNVILSQEYINTLKAGSYKVVIENATHIATATLTVKKVESAKTFDAGVALYAGMALSSAFGAAYVSRKKK